MRQGFEGRRHHVEYRSFFATEDLARDFVRCLRGFTRQIEHLGLAIAMVLDKLIRAMPMVVVDAAVRRQDQLDVELLHLEL